MLNTWAKFLFLLTHVSLSLTLSETLWQVAAVTEVQPCSVLINHPVTLFSSLSSLSLSSFVPFTTYLSPLPFPLRHSLYLCPLSLPLLSPFCSSVFISPSCQSLRPSPAISNSPALILSFLFPLCLSLLSGLSLEALIFAQKELLPLSSPLGVLVRWACSKSSGSLGEIRYCWFLTFAKWWQRHGIINGEGLLSYILCHFCSMFTLLLLPICSQSLHHLALYNRPQNTLYVYRYASVNGYSHRNRLRNWLRCHILSRKWCILAILHHGEQDFMRPSLPLFDFDYI